MTVLPLRGSRAEKIHFLVVALFVAGFFLSSCVSVETPAERRANADRLTSAADWVPLQLDAGSFVLSAYTPATPDVVPVLTIYIEGDGFAWLTPAQPAADPSPRNPLALRLAVQHPDNAVAWLGRPCQFVAVADWRTCNTHDWTDGRFSEAVVAASDNAISQLKARRHAQQIVLIGYSGGGAIAALVAARRNDVQRLLTVAGNLDHREWTRWHNVAPLTNSLNPADVAAALVNIPQTHWVGGRDNVVGRRLADSFAAKFPGQQQPAIYEVANADHSSGWIEIWPDLLRQSGY